ncbi:TetR/AcrR family transcriptional regulator [Saccharopolyspora hirsuta]|uniref:TetR/AcrR family transcriptional regulator n=1 Tax=Saccharopolyspora hirsuta TaxID=1837 RepID=UPI003324D4DA
MADPSSPPAAPRRRLAEDERRRQIIAAAIEELAEGGYERASLTRIAARAGVSKGLIWHYFSGKDDLMESVASATATAIRERIASRLDLTEPVPAVIRAALRHVARLSVDHRAELVALTHIAHNLRHPDGSPRLTPDHYEASYRAQEVLFRRGQAEGTLRDFDTRVMAITYQGSIDAMLAHLQAHPEVDPESYADQLAELLLDGIKSA